MWLSLAVVVVGAVCAIRFFEEIKPSEIKKIKITVFILYNLLFNGNEAIISLFIAVCKL